MAKLSQLERGMRARLRGVECSTLGGIEFTCDLLVLRGDQEERVIANARKRAKELAGSDGEKDLNFLFACAVETVLLAAADPDSSDQKPEPFFDSDDQIRGELDRERILYLAELQRAFQERISPRQLTLSDDQFYSHVVGLLHDEEGDSKDHPFWTWPRSTQWSFLTTLARQHVLSQELRSASGGSGETAPPNG